VDPQRIIVTAGASAALQLAMLALVDAGDDVLLPDPSYPCNRHFVSAAGGQPRLIATSAQQRFQLDARQVAEHWSPRTAGVLLASPSNPTGTSIDPQELDRIVQAVRQRGGWTVVDEIYLGLSYDPRYGQSALALGEDVISVNSFSKTFGLTGWRLGWLVVPPELVAPIERLAQNLYICASTVAQRAALACFEESSLREAQRRRGEFKRRRDYVLRALQDLGWPVPVEPDGAFYAWIDTSGLAPDSWDLCLHLMHEAQVTLTPGRDFGPSMAASFMRLSYASSMETLQEAMARLRGLHLGLHLPTAAQAASTTR
jgi:aspartate/methionine/tyrosine aminotransferase